MTAGFTPPRLLTGRVLLLVIGIFAAEAILAIKLLLF